MFNKKDRSKFKYWFAHWCAYQMTALNLGGWKFKYLFHDIEKPFMLYFYMWICRMNHEDAYKRVQKWHRFHRKHHIEYNGKKDYDAMVIDWECSRFTKTKSQLTACEEKNRLQQEGRLSDDDKIHLHNSLYKFGLTGKNSEVVLRIM